MRSTLRVTIHNNSSAHGSKQNVEDTQLGFYLNILNATHNAFYIQHMSLIRPFNALTLVHVEERPLQCADNVTIEVSM